MPWRGHSERDEANSQTCSHLVGKGRQAFDHAVRLHNRENPLDARDPIAEPRRSLGKRLSLTEFNHHTVYSTAFVLLAASCLSRFVTSRSPPRVEAAVDGLQAGGVDVGVDLRGGDAGMAEHLLYEPQVDSPR